MSDRLVGKEIVARKTPCGKIHRARFGESSGWFYFGWMVTVTWSAVETI